VKPFHRLDLTDGSFTLVEAPTLDRASKIRAYHIELLNLIQMFDYAYLVQTDPVLFSNFEAYYRAIGQLMRPTIDPSQLTSESRHSFFIAAQLTTAYDAALPDDPTIILELSHLEQLMGYSLPDPTLKPSDEIRLTSGDDDCDLVAALQLCFKSSALEMTRRYCRQDLINILKQAQNLMRGDAAIKELQSAKDKELFEKNQASIERQFKDMGANFF
jgi:hypothetical protein